MNTTSKPLRTLLQVLEEENLVNHIESHKTSRAIKIANNVIKVAVLDSSTEAHQINKKAQEILPNGQGRLLLTTTHGIITHVQALSERIGRKIIAAVEIAAEN